MMFPLFDQAIFLTSSPAIPCHAMAKFRFQLDKFLNEIRHPIGILSTWLNIETAATDILQCLHAIGGRGRIESISA